MKEIKFDEKGLVPAIVQHYQTGQVLMLAYMNEEALNKTLESGKVHFWSRSRKKLWLKGETSGHFLYLKELRLDCDGDTLLLKVEPVSGVCHTGHYSCFYRKWDPFSREWKETEEIYGKKVCEEVGG